jgi:putative tricarboxylic transport membrane protein
MLLSIIDPIIFLLCIVGVYGDRNNPGDVWVMLLFGFLGYFLSKSGYSLAGFILGFTWRVE